MVTCRMCQRFDLAAASQHNRRKLLQLLSFTALRLLYLSPSELPATTLRPTVVVVVVVVGKSNTPLIYSFSTLEPLTRVVLFNVKY